MNRERVESAARLVITVVVAGIGAGAGFTHTHAWAVANGQGGWLAWADAVVIECMAVVAGLRIHGRGRRRFPLIVLVAAVVLQMVAQVAMAPRTPAGWLLAAVPAAGCLVIVKLALADVMRADVQTSRRPDVSTVVRSEVERTDVPELEARSEPVVTEQAEPVAATWPPR